MNLLDRIYLDFVEFVGTMPDNSLGLLIRLALILTIPLAACAFAFAQGQRNSIVMVALLVFGILLAFLVPIAPIVENLRSIWKLYVFILSLMAIAFVPATLPFFLTPYWGKQRILIKIFYIMVLIILGVGLPFYR